jgi:hypothetical protein
VKYEFQTKPSIIESDNHHVKHLYFGEDLVGIGEGNTQRQAKINCAREALKNLELGKTLQKPMPKNGLLAFLQEKKDLTDIFVTDPDQFVI